MAVVVVKNFIPDESWTRSGAERDPGLIRDAFEKHYDCQVRVFSDDKEHTTTREKFESAVISVQRAMANEANNFDLLFWVISSHGGTNEHGSFFWDSEGDMIYLYQDLIEHFRVDKCPAMAGKAAFYLPSFCRVPGGFPTKAVRPMRAPERTNYAKSKDEASS